MTGGNFSERTLGRTHLALLFFALVTTLTIAGQTWWAIAQDKQQTLASETNNGLVAVRLLEEHANQTLQDAVHTLDRVARAVRASNQYDAPARIREIISSHDIGHSRHLKALQYVTPQGIRVRVTPLSSGSTPISRSSVSSKARNAAWACASSGSDSAGSTCA